MSPKYTNSLINESSPYLLQHAHNPVDWYPWGEAALNKARTENKMMLISIGYSACHWCHVMEHNCFENEQLAMMMNRHFVCIKVDREERPDIDQIYMSAVQLMTGSGGWPLNCFTLPDGRPVYGGTYFPPEQWANVLNNLVHIYKNEYDKMLDYAVKLTEGINMSDEIVINKEKPQFSKEDLGKTVDKWKRLFDTIDGGPNRAPKFPLPNNFQFLLRYHYHSKEENLLNYIHLTLTKMAMGGIYDQAGGGFSRYSVDGFWKVPHFEKMLYDNGQLMSLYSDAYALSKDELYKNVVYQTFGFIENEMTSPEYGFYSALDADSEGEEGKFYVWKSEELKELLGNDYDLAAQYYCIDKEALWEHGNNILLRRTKDDEIAKEFNWSLSELREKVKRINEKILTARSKRVRPGLDDKILTSWNALMNMGLTDAYFAFGGDAFLKLAEKNMDFLIHKQKRNDGGLNRNYKNGKSVINAYLDDYSFTIEALLKLYTATGKESYLSEAIGLTDYVIAHFWDEENSLFFYTSDLDEKLIARKSELNDNVIPASNSSMAKCLFYLGTITGNEAYMNKSKAMLMNIKPHMMDYGSGYSNWALLHLYYSYNVKEVVISGPSALENVKELKSRFLPDAFILPCIADSVWPLFKGRFHINKDMIYVCENNSCKMPVGSLEEAVDLVINKH